MLVALVSVLANAGSSLLGRKINHQSGRHQFFSTWT
jgi:hypothetical protein